MRLEISLSKIVEVVSAVSRVVASRPQLPVLANILLEAEAAGLRVSATDLAVGVSWFLPAKVETEGKTTVPAKIFLDYITSLRGERAGLEKVGSKLVVSSGSYSGEMQTIEASEFPSLSRPPKEGVEIEAKRLALAIEKVSFAAAKDSLRPVLTGVLFEMTEKKLRLVATDGFRLALNEIAISGGVESLMVVPLRAVVEMMRFAREGKIRLSYLPETRQMVAVSSEAVLLAQVLEGSFPDYRKILPKAFRMRFSVNREEVLQTVRSVSVFARDNSNVMRWQVVDGELVAVSSAGERGQGKASCGVLIEEGESAGVSFNSKYIIDFLSGVSCENVSIGLGEALAPSLFREDGSEDYLYVVMPINA